MIIANIVGGLGNQMFQYACARALSLESGLPLKVCLDTFKHYTVHNGYELQRVFNLEVSEANTTDLHQLLGKLRATSFARLLIGKYPNRLLAGSKFIAEQSYVYDTKIAARAAHGGYLHGYWQSEKYFAKYGKAIRQDFSFNKPLTGRNAELAEVISCASAISVHVRRGDYVSNQKAAATHGCCTLAYYQQALAYIRERNPEARIFAFSDDPTYVEETLQPFYPSMTIVSHNSGLDSYEDMRLMSLCDHHVLANSSFSWWGAWLNPNSEKIVVAPKQWFANNTDTRDLIPENWVRM